MEEAKKFDQGKNRLDLFPIDALELVGLIYTYGAKEHGEHNWDSSTKGGFRWGRLFAAMLRHAFAFWRGEDFDKDSGYPHVAHMAWNALALCAYFLRGLGEDDRHPVEGAEDVLQTLAKRNKAKKPSKAKKA